MKGPLHIFARLTGWDVDKSIAENNDVADLKAMKKVTILMAATGVGFSVPAAYEIFHPSAIVEVDSLNTYARIAGVALNALIAAPSISITVLGGCFAIEALSMYRDVNERLEELS